MLIPFDPVPPGSTKFVQPPALLTLVLYWTCRSRMPWVVEYQSKEKVTLVKPAVLVSASTPCVYSAAPAACVAQPLWLAPRTRSVFSLKPESAVPAVLRMSSEAELPPL